MNPRIAREIQDDEPTDEEIEIFVKVFESLDYEKLCLIAAQAIIRAAEK